MSNASFLPEDYLEQKAERRTNLISLTLFAIVMVSVFAAFLVTNRQWSRIKSAQREINQQYQTVAVDIDRLNELEQQKLQMLKKAELAAALVERVPRSVLLWELIDRMPARLGLLQFSLKADKVRAARPKRTERKTTRGRRRASRQRQANNEVSDAPRYSVKVKVVGIAPDDRDVSEYVSELDEFRLLSDVRLAYTQETKFDEQIMRQFEINMTLDPEFDARHLKPLAKSDRIEESMSDEIRFTGQP